MESCSELSWAGTTMRGRMDSRIAFDLWTAGGSWFWSFTQLCGKRAAIGAASTEGEAVREARSAIAQPLADKLQEYTDFTKDIVKTGKFKVGDPLEPRSTGTT